MTVLTQEQVEAFATALETAAHTRTPALLLTDTVPEMTLSDGYRVARVAMEKRLKGGDRLAGWKVGLMSAASRAQVGVEEPIGGYILASGVYSEDATIETKTMISPGVEAEIAFLVGKDLAGPGVSLNTALLAVKGALPALEVVDRRYAAGKRKGADLAADNNSQAGAVIGSRVVPLSQLDLPLEGLIWERNGEIVATATGAAVNGNPLNSVVWLANKLAEWGMKLHAGDIVLAGSVCTALFLAAGETARARFTRLGSVSARFV